MHVSDTVIASAAWRPRAARTEQAASGLLRLRIATTPGDPQPAWIINNLIDDTGGGA
jgi:hypothetical protein